MKILFVLPMAEKYTGSPAAPLGAISLCTYLNRLGHEAWICDRMMNHLDLEEELKNRHPDIVGISTVSALGFNDATQIARIAREHGAHVVAGGPVASMMPESMLRNGIAEIVSIGEGETSWLHIIEYYEGKRK
ncbi:MAG: cobalamin-dependent protein, partial [Clostridia bacterium]|nr:cobalamin-dependent protein [Clostridia bacterium]